MSAGMVSAEASPRPVDGGLAVSTHGPHMFVCILISSYKDTSHIRLGPILIAHCNLITSLKILSSNTVAF